MGVTDFLTLVISCKNMDNNVEYRMKGNGLSMNKLVYLM